jgi:hypothetical protein
VAHREPPWPGDQFPAQDTVEILAETGEEITQPIPPVVTGPPPGEQTTTGLPLLDVLAPGQAPASSRLPPATRATRAAVSPPARASRRPPRNVLIAGAALIVVLLVLVGWLLLRPSPSVGPTGRSASTTQPSSTTPAATTPSPTVRVVGSYQFTQQATRADTECAANAYGRVADFLRAKPCTALDRALYTTTAEGRPAVASVSIVQMPDESAAAELQKLADTSGTGNISDLLRSGVRVPGGPDNLTAAGYASARSGSTVVIVEADFADPAVRDVAALDRLSRAALQLRK